MKVILFPVDTFQNGANEGRVTRNLLSSFVDKIETFCLLVIAGEGHTNER
jgi:hypothetical protein